VGKVGRRVKKGGKVRKVGRWKGGKVRSLEGLSVLI